MLEAIRELPFDVGNGVQIHKTCSIGWAPFPWLLEDVGLLSIDNVIELADKALYLAKREGRNRSYGMLPAETDVPIGEERDDREFAGLPAGSGADRVVSCNQILNIDRILGSVLV